MANPPKIKVNRKTNESVMSIISEMLTTILNPIITQQKYFSGNPHKIRNDNEKGITNRKPPNKSGSSGTSGGQFISV